MHTGLLDLQLVSGVYHGLSNDNSVVEFSPKKYKINQKVFSWTERGQDMRLRGRKRWKSTSSTHINPRAWQKKAIKLLHRTGSPNARMCRQWSFQDNRTENHIICRHSWSGTSTGLKYNHARCLVYQMPQDPSQKDVWQPGGIKNKFGITGRYKFDLWEAKFLKQM